MKNDFENFLMEKHAEQYVGTDDMMPDDFNDWVTDLDVEDLIKFGNEFARVKQPPSVSRVEEILKKNTFVTFEGQTCIKQNVDLAQKIIDELV